MDIYTLVRKLRSERNSVGVWFVPLEYLEREEKNIENKLGLKLLDARTAFLESLPKGATHSGLKAPSAQDKLSEFIRAMGDKIYDRDCLLIHTFDLLLLALEVDARKAFWNAVLPLPYLPTKLVIALPEKGEFLLSVLQQRVSQVARGTL